MDLRLLVVVASMALASCTTVSPYRTDVPAKCEPAKAGAESLGPNSEKATVEHYPKFDIGYVEFTDQGWLHNRKQLNCALELVRKSDARDLQIVVFVHRNNFV